MMHFKYRKLYGKYSIFFFESIMELLRRCAVFFLLSRQQNTMEPIMTAIYERKEKQSDWPFNETSITISSQ